MANDNRKIWLVVFPTYQYKEDVKVLARQKNLKIVDKKHGKGFDEKFLAADSECPKLTVLAKYKKEETKA